jgi:aldehyde dehydrogenase (NAD+)
MTTADIPSLVAQLKSTFRSRRTRSYEWRVHQLEQLKAMTEENELRIFDALAGDLGRAAQESFLTEIHATIQEIDHAIGHLENWMRPASVPTPLSNQPGYSEIVREPLGVALILAPWNYPFLLLMQPLIGAIAAGNCALLKPSELAPRTSKLTAEIVGGYLDADAIRVIEGGADIAAGLLEQHFDHIFFTGSQRVGRIVMTAAAKHLTPVTLELGGKCPCIVDEDTDLTVAARRIAWGKFINAGQTCVAPDYVLVHQRIHDDLLAHLENAIAGFFGDDPSLSPDYPRIVNEQHFDRITGLMQSGRIVFGGETDREANYIAPTLISEVPEDAPLMSEEIFGPVLPIIPVTAIDAAIVHVAKRPKPLALYLFSRDEKLHERILAETSSGGVCINDVVVHLAVPELPFGGVGESGMGKYHGRASFETFSHAKSVLTKSESLEIPLRYPPYSESKFKWLRRLL